MFRPFILLVALFSIAPTAAGQPLPDTAVRRMGGDAAGDRMRGVYLLAYSPGGKFLATRSRDQIVRIWDTDTGKVRHTLDGHQDRVTSLAYSVDGRYLATTSPGSGETVHIWDTTTGQAVHKLKHAALIVEFPTDGGSFVIVTQAKAIFYGATTFKQTREVSLDLSPSMTPLALSPDAKSLACYKSRAGSSNYSIIVRDIEGGNQKQLAEVTAIPVAGRFAPNNQHLIVSCRRRRDIHVFKLDDRIDHEVRPAHDAQTQSLAFSPDGRLLATASWDKSVRLWDTLTGRVAATLSGHTEHVCAVRFSSDGWRLASAASGLTDNSTVLWDVRRILFGGERDRAKLSDEELTRTWEALAADPPKALRAVGMLVRAPNDAGPYLTKRVKELVPASSSPVIDQLIADLHSPKFEVRQTAHEKLIELHVLAEVQLRQALEVTKSAEAKRRIASILRRKRSERKLSEAQRLRVHRMIQALELIGTAEMKQQLIALATGFANSEVIAAARAAADRLPAAEPPK